MSPEQLRTLADKFERSRPAPAGYQTPGDYVVNLSAHEMARFLREMADEESMQR